MKFYKVFRVQDGRLYSAFEGWPRKICAVDERRRLQYALDSITEDPKLGGEPCPGLMIMMSLDKARQFLNECPRYIRFALYEVDPKDKVTIPYEEIMYSIFESAYTDKLLVSDHIESNGEDPS